MQFFLFSFEVVLCHSWHFEFAFHDSHVVKNEIIKSIIFYFVQEIFSTNQSFVGVILGYISPTAFPKECSYLWWLSMIQVFSYPLDERRFHLFVDLKQAIVFVSGRLWPHSFEMFFHKPTTNLFVSLLVFQQLHYNLLGRVLSKFTCGKSCHFLLHSFIPAIYLLFFLPKALWCCSFHSSFRIVKIMSFSCLSI